MTNFRRYPMFTALNELHKAQSAVKDFATKPVKIANDRKAKKAQSARYDAYLAELANFHQHRSEHLIEFVVAGGDTLTERLEAYYNCEQCQTYPEF